MTISKVILKPLLRIKVDGLENLKENDKIIVCANHKSFLDPVLLAIVLPRKINFMAKKELFDKPLVSKFLRSLGAFPVDRFAFDMKSLRHSLKLIKEDKVLGVFPEGTRVKEANREKVKDGLAYLAIKGKADILPVEIISTYRPFKQTYIYINEIIKVDDYLSMKNKDAMKKMTDKVYERIYENHTVIESENKWK